MLKRGGFLAASLLTALGFAVAGCGGGDDEAGVTVDLGTQNESGQSGTATLTADGEKTTVTIELSNPPGDAQPAHIHAGTCAELNPQPEFPLANVVDGKSETTVDAPLSALEGEDYAINIHMSEADVETYVACGDIPKG
jgi:hypothetical protein